MHSFKLLESFGLNEGKYDVLDEHFERMTASASTFQFHLPLPKIRSELSKIKELHFEESWKVRLLISENGDCEWTVDRIHSLSSPVFANIADASINSESVFLYHKTTNRSIYNEHKSQDDGIFDTLLWNEHEEITEFTIGNIVYELNDCLYTPPVSCGLLNGTYRRHLLKKGVIQERILPKNELNRATRIWLINSVRKWIAVELAK